MVKSGLTKEFCLVNGRVMTPHRVLNRGGIHIRGEKIAQVFDMDDENSAGTFQALPNIDVGGAWIVPGFIDMHAHGGGGGDFMDASKAALAAMAASHAAGGTTSLIPTTLTSSLSQLEAALDNFASCRDSITGARLWGVHLEGPYFSYEQRGAQDPRYLKYPDRDEYLQILDKYPFIVRVSAAPELPGGLELGRELRKRGILAAIGHSNATYEEILQAVDAGYSHITHLWSGMPGVRRVNCFRVAGPVESGLLLDSLTVEVIADGKHLPPALLKLAYKCKGSQGMALCSDALAPAGMGEGRYILGSAAEGQEIIVDDGVAWLPDGSAFAGSVVTGNDLVRTMVELAGIPLKEAVEMATATPARILGINDVTGSLDAGKYGDITVLDEELSVVRTFVGGQEVFAS
ncbi:MAG: N-acetylglucosamine-6-phosphate deacetylase [Firmicutes bacterium]|nr:N-acetylglucosamine-6-phosphate deacetylase [Bacillota bacterium]